MHKPKGNLRSAEARQNAKGIPLRQAISAGTARKPTRPARDKARMKLVGRLRHLRRETARISKLIAREFEKIEREDWA